MAGYTSEQMLDAMMNGAHHWRARLAATGRDGEEARVGFFFLDEVELAVVRDALAALLPLEANPVKESLLDDVIAWLAESEQIEKAA